MRSICRVVALAPVLWFGFVIMHAQQPADTPPAGTVTGTVTCSDTQRPARFAGVTLIPVPDDKPAAKTMPQKDKEADPAAAMKMARDNMGSATMLHEQTGLDGTYTISNVPPGDYYLSSSAPGYVSTVAAAQAAAPPGTTGRKLFVGVPVLHVEANRMVRGDVTLDRGAALAGTVTFDDGSPAGSLVMTLEKIEPAKSEDTAVEMVGSLALMFAGAGGGRSGFADDRGHYRVAGIPPGDYTIKAAMQVNTSFSMRQGLIGAGNLVSASPLIFYAPGTVHKKDAAKITLGAGEERGDANIVINLMGMHSVSGRVASAVDHHGLNAGTVTVVDATDKEFKRTAVVDATGAFTVAFVPPGTYTLEVSGGGDTELRKMTHTGVVFASAAAHTVKSYENGSQSLVVTDTDVTGVNVELKESKTVKKDVDADELFKSN